MQAALRDPIGATGSGFDQPFSPQPVENAEVEIGEYHAFAREACNGDNLGTFVPLMQNTAAKGQNVQCTLFVS